MKYILILLIAAALSIAGACVYFLLFINHVGENETGIVYNLCTGEVAVQDGKGFHTTPPYMLATTIKTLPIPVSITSKAKVLNTKLVRFRPEGTAEYIKLHGFSYGMNQYIADTLLGYAYSGREWPFLEIIDESAAKSAVPKTSERSGIAVNN